MNITKSKLKQIIKEEVEKVLEMRDQYRDEWGTYSYGDSLKWGDAAYYPWFNSHWRDQILKKAKRGEQIPLAPHWRRISRELNAAGIYRPGPEADAFIEDLLTTMRQETEYPHIQKDIPRPERWRDDA